MGSGVSRFYEEMYAEGREGKEPGGLLGQMFLRLRRFELHRVAATYQLLEPGGRLLDLGCGDGTLLAHARRTKFNAVYGLDVAQAVTRRAQETCERILGTANGATIQQADLNEALPFEDGFFDTVTAIAVIEHIFDPYVTMAEVHRVLRPGGQFVMEVPNLVWLPRRLDVLFGRLPITGDEEGWDGGHLHYFTFQAVRDLLVQQGFVVQYMGSTGILPRLRNVWPTMLGGNILVNARKLNRRA
jgi:methionine biosynthesis protein MetW